MKGLESEPHSEERIKATVQDVETEPNESEAGNEKNT